MRQQNLYMYTIEMVMNETAELIHIMSVSFGFRENHSRMRSNNIPIDKVNCFGDRTTI